MCKVTKRLLWLVLCFLLWLAAGTGSQAETMYTISESELTQLETNLQTLKSHNETKQQLLTEQKKQLETVNKQLAELKRLNDQTQKSLEKANQSLTELEKEARHKVQVKARQRNLWIGVAGVAVYLYVRKAGA